MKSREKKTQQPHEIAKPRKLDELVGLLIHSSTHQMSMGSSGAIAVQLEPGPTNNQLIPNQAWLEAETNAIVQKCDESAPWLRKQVKALVGKHLTNWATLIESVPDDVLVRRPGASAEWWDIAEQNASEALVAQSGTQPSQLSGAGQQHGGTLWSETTYNRSFYFDRIIAPSFKSRVGLNPIYKSNAPETSWLRSGNTFWARGVIFLEGAMRAYLRNIGFGLQNKVGGFWGELGVTKGDRGFEAASAPSWRWQLLREAYLASWMWGWAQLLHSPSSPFDRKCQDDLCSALSSMSSMYKWAWGWPHSQPATAPSLMWRGESIQILAEEYFMPFTGKHVKEQFNEKAKRMIRQLLAQETAFQCCDSVTESAHDQRLQYFGTRFPVDPTDVGQIIGTAIPFTLRDRPGCFRLDSHGKWVGDVSIEYHPFKQFVGNHSLLGLHTAEEICAFNLLGNLLLAPQSRYASLRFGFKFKRALKRAGLPDVGLPLFGQFGLLETQEWLKSPGLWLLFDGCRLGPSERGLLVRKRIPMDEFGNWLQLLPEQIIRLWKNVERAPLSFPLIAPNTGQPDSDHLWAIKWMGRLVRSAAHGKCPFSLLPINQNPYQNPGGDPKAFIDWRQRIWGPIYAGLLPERGPSLDEGECADGTHGILSSCMDLLYRDWVQGWGHHRGD